MKKVIPILLSITLSLVNYSVIAQKSTELFIPKEIKKAYKNGTRTLDGKPGENYFQNRTDYAIKAEFFPEKRIIQGSEIITYHNNSKDTLSTIYIKLYQDLLKKGGFRNWDIGPVDIHDGTEIITVKINDDIIDLSSDKVKRNATIMSIGLPEKILPQSANKIEVEWKLIIPGTVPIRMGTYQETNFMIAYWYPKLAVYDDISGWDLTPYTGRLEFYNEYGDYDVEITVPSSYNVWSSGLLQNADAIFTKKYLNRIKQAAESDEVIHIISKEDREKDKITKKAEKHTWKFKAINRCDFAFAVSNKYLWDATSLNTNGKRVSVHAVYKENSKDFNEVADIGRKAIGLFSDSTPAIPYPYPQLVAFNGGGGMEFSGMVNDGDARDRNGTLHLTAHEIGHTYFPFYVGTNEKKYAWMDEGLISFFPRKVVAKYTLDKGFNPYRTIIERYNKSAGSELEVPLMILSENALKSYRYHAYQRSCMAFYTLHEYLGEKKFDAALREFAKRWNSKHPTPYDFFHTFNEVAQEDLGWFWHPWFFELKYVDLAIGKLTQNKDKQTIEILNHGGLPIQVNLKAIYNDGSEKNVYKSADVWKNNIKSIEIELPKGELKALQLDTEYAPDAFPEDNILNF